MAAITPAQKPLDSNAYKRPVVGYFKMQSILTTGALFFAGFIFIWPFLCLLGWTFNQIDASMNPLTPIPAKFSLDFYTLMFTRYNFGSYVWNSIYVVGIQTILSTIFSALAGYALAKLQFPGKRLLFIFVLGIMLLPLGTMLVPMYVVMRDLKLVNNYWGLILPSVGGGAFNIFLMRQFMLGIPTEMLEAARIDGCNEFNLFTEMVLPNGKAAIGVVATLTLRGAWNSLLWPQIIIGDDKMQLLMPAIARLNQMGVGDPYSYPVAATAAMVAAIVPLAVYAFSQRYFVETLAGAIKG